MSSAVLDFQGFQLSPESFIVKELEFYDIENGYHGRWSFQPPHAWEELPPKKKSTYSWVIRNIHGMSWTSGDLPYTALRSILTTLFAVHKTLYVKGLQKTKFLQKLTDFSIVNLDEMDCPKLPMPKVSCPHHTTDEFSCALSKATAYAQYVASIKDVPL
ncbi:hypothetical protein RF55_25011 [Lasius niger]|uniref:Uncharacterized protein n=1 Tax=Lasius niger TaxID=67767 RepID=A0A0J7JVF8_LASNI|nr:hypothetical protein RF55_25011 [Lasius niger]